MSNIDDAEKALFGPFKYQTREDKEQQRTTRPNNSNKFIGEHPRATFDEFYSADAVADRISKRTAEAKKQPASPFLTRPINKVRAGKQLTTEDKDYLRAERRHVILHDISKALDSAANYYLFIQMVGYNTSTVPRFENVASLTLENDKLCINEIPEDQEEDDIKPETE